MKVQLLGHCGQETINKQLQIMSSAGRLSRTPGKVLSVYETSTDYDANFKLIKGVMGYGHETIAEHDYLVFALEDVTPIVEQTIISYRLSSFTIKSRREGNFTEEGHYMPSFRDKEGNILPNNEELQKMYNENAQNLFDTYAYYVQNGIPYQDARYILPYSFHANIIMGMNGRELKKMCNDLLHGKQSHIAELRELGEKIKDILDVRAPYISHFLNKSEKTAEDHLDFLDEIDILPKQASPIEKTQITGWSEGGDEIVAITAIAARYQLSIAEATDALLQMQEKDPDIMAKIIRGVMHNDANRELEAVTYQFEFPSSLAVLTHFTRHRMWSMLIPDFVPIWDLNRMEIPQSIREFDLESFINAKKSNIELYEKFKSMGVSEEDLIYFYLSGNIANINATINARSLKWMSHQRTCKKVQPETRQRVIEMVELAKEKTPLLGEYYGPNCEVYGICKEGKDSCKVRGVQKLELKPKNN